MRFLIALLVCSASATASAQEWREIESQDCGISFEFPGHASVSVDTTALRNGLTVVTREYAVVVNRDFHNLTCSDFPNGFMASVGVDAFLDGGVERSTSGQEVVRSEVATLDGHPGRRYTTRVPIGQDHLMNHYVAFVIGDRVYQLAVAAFDSSEGHVARFFDSLRLTHER